MLELGQYDRAMTLPPKSSVAAQPELPYASRTSLPRLSSTRGVDNHTSFVGDTLCACASPGYEGVDGRSQLSRNGVWLGVLILTASGQN